MDRLIRRRDVEELVGLSRSSIYKYIAEGTFPTPIKVGKTAVRFRLSDVQAWVANKVEAR